MTTSKYPAKIFTAISFKMKDKIKELAEKENISIMEFIRRSIQCRIDATEKINEIENNYRNIFFLKK